MSTTPQPPQGQASQTQAPLDIKATAQELRNLYSTNTSQEMGHFLVIGEKGAGKTSLALTCPKPILIHSFDPGGTALYNVPEMVKRGELLVDNRYEVDDYRHPSAYLEWEKEFNRLRRGDFFKSVGTYVLDSLTTFGNSMIWRIMQKENRIPPGMDAAMDEKAKGMRIQDYMQLLNHTVRTTRIISSLPCHTLILGHIGRDLNEADQRVIRLLLYPGQSKDQVPINLPEFYVLLKEGGPKGATRYLLTEDDGEYRATTRMGGGGVFAKKEEPNIRALLKKAKRPYEDRPLFL